MSFNREYELSKGQRKGKFDRSSKKTGHSAGDNPSNSGLAQVFAHTKEITPTLFPSIEGSMLFRGRLPEIPSDSIGFYNALVEVLNIDALELASYYASHGMKPLVLNMASDRHPGGGVKAGKTAQEECLFRRTTAFASHPKEWYGLEHNDFIYAPEVHIIKDLDHQVLKKENMSRIGMASVAALRHPKLIKGEYHEDDRRLMEEKIDNIFKIGIAHGHDALVLGAFGCGVFGNPPLQVAQIFRSMIHRYRKFFKVIGFAVLVVNKGRDTDNLTTFKNVLLPKVK